MSATTQNCVYTFGKKLDGKKEKVLSRKELDDIKASVKKYFEVKKKQ